MADRNGQSEEGLPPDLAFEDECFFITPIGKSGSEERKRADGLLEAVVGPSAAALDLTPIRADKIAQGGHITLQVLEHCANAKAAIADLTGGNLNVYYEVGIRHALRQPLILLADESERGTLPFDLLQQRTIFYTNDMAGAAAAQRDVTDQLRTAIGGHVDSPVQAAMNLRAFQEGNAVERTLAELVTKVDAMSSRLSVPRPVVPTGVARDLLMGAYQLSDVAGASDDGGDIVGALETMAPAVLWNYDRARGAKRLRGDPDIDFAHALLEDLGNNRRRRRAKQHLAELEGEPANDSSAETEPEAATEEEPDGQDDAPGADGED